jgi:hypothetical protein
MIDFPANPTVGQTFSSGGFVWTWDGVKWVASGGAASGYFPINDNRIINGDMRIDQRNNGAAGTTNGYTVDRWQFTASLVTKGNWGRNIGSVTPAPGFPYYLGFSSNSAYTPLASDFFQFVQQIEADMVSDFGWGTASAQPVTLSFWAYSSLTGTFSASVSNANNTRSYPFTYSIPSANTWTKIVIAIPGDTTGTWPQSGNGSWGGVHFDLGAGATYRGPANAWAATNYLGVTGSVSVVATNGAYLFLTGVKLEVGSVATPFNRQSLAKSMIDCQRYYQTFGGSIYVNQAGGNYCGVTVQVYLPVVMRANPSIGGFVLLGTGGGFVGTGLSVFGQNVPSSFAVYPTSQQTTVEAYTQFTGTASAEL